MPSLQLWLYLQFWLYLSDEKILILGAGMSGVAAAKKLKELGYTNFEIIEGSNRVGGRVFHLTMGNTVVEMGPMVVHAAPDNPVLELINKYNVSIQQTNYDDWIVRARNGTDVTDLADQIYEEKWEPAVELITGENDPSQHEHRPDSSMKSAFLKSGWNPQSFIDDVIEYFEIDWLYGYGPEETSAKFSTFPDVVADIDAYGEFFMKDERGYVVIIKNLLDEVLGNDTDKLHINKVVSKIEEKDNKVTVTTDANETYVGDRVIVTFSLSVLQSDIVGFSPELPEWKTDAIQQFQMSQYTTIHIQFNTMFWDDAEWILYADDTEAFNLILNMNKIHPGCNILSVEASNKEAVRVERLTNDEVKQEVMDKLRKVYINSIIPDPINFRMSRYSQFPLYRGAWGNWPPGYTMDSFHALQAPVSRVYFAGDHTSFKYYGYLHGAYLSGEEVVDKLDKCIQRGVCQKYVPLYDARGCRYTAASNFDHKVKQDDGSCKFPCVSSSRLIKSSVTVLGFIVALVILL